MISMGLVVHYKNGIGLASTTSWFWYLKQELNPSYDWCGEWQNRNHIRRWRKLQTQVEQVVNFMYIFILINNSGDSELTSFFCIIIKRTYWFRQTENKNQYYRIYEKYKPCFQMYLNSYHKLTHMFVLFCNIKSIIWN